MQRVSEIDLDQTLASIDSKKPLQQFDSTDPDTPLMLTLDQAGTGEPIDPGFDPKHVQKQLEAGQPVIPASFDWSQEVGSIFQPFDLDKVAPVADSIGVKLPPELFNSGQPKAPAMVSMESLPDIEQAQGLFDSSELNS